MRHIRELDGLRGLMALWVVIGHTLGCFSPLFGPISNSLYNEVPVQVFIILSGFVIFSLLNSTEISYGKYIIGRAFRIFPVYIVTLLISTLTLGWTESVLRAAPVGVATVGRIQIIDIAQENLIAHFIAHLTLLQGLLPGSLLPNSSTTLVGQAWSLTVEWQFYLVAPFLFFAIRFLNIKRLIALVAVVVICRGVAPRMDAGFIGNNLYLFSVGFISYFWHRNWRLSFTKKWRVVCLAFIILFTAIFMSVHLAAVIIWCVSLSVVESLDDLNIRVNPICSVLSSKVATYLGSISYPLYMVHVQVMFACIWMANVLEFSPAIRIAFLPAATVAGSILLSDILHRTIESPLQTIGRRLSREKFSCGKDFDVAR